MLVLLLTSPFRFLGACGFAAAVLVLPPWAIHSLLQVSWGMSVLVYFLSCVLWEFIHQ